MASPDDLDFSRHAGELRAKLGRVGVWWSTAVSGPAADARRAAAEVEQLGYSTFWYGETAMSKDAFAQAAILLSATSLTTMRRYLDAMDEAPYAGARPAAGVRRVLAALRPAMTALAGERSAGAHPYFVPVEHTIRTRDALGPQPLLAPEQAFVLQADPDHARNAASAHMAPYLAMPNYASNLRALGYTDDDITGGGSNRLVDAIVAWGDPDAVAARVQAHLDAGADHVALQPLGDPGSAAAMLRAVAPALTAP